MCVRWRRSPTQGGMPSHRRISTTCVKSASGTVAASNHFGSFSAAAATAKLAQMVEDARQGSR